MNRLSNRNNPFRLRHSAIRLQKKVLELSTTRWSTTLRAGKLVEVDRPIGEREIAKDVEEIRTML
ncbi:MAG TPA: hypothetical protein VGB89_09820 [Bacteroidota bacterium]